MTKSNLREGCLPWRSQEREIKYKSLQDRGWNNKILRRLEKREVRDGILRRREGQIEGQSHWED